MDILQPTLLGAAQFASRSLFVKGMRSRLFATYTPLHWQAAVYLASVPVAAIQMNLFNRWTSTPAPNPHSDSSSNILESRLRVVMNGLISTASAAALESIALVWMPNTFYGGWKSGITKVCAWMLWSAAVQLIIVAANARASSTNSKPSKATKKTS
ncbi:hypothetical protein BJ741DRAFT_626245 [Chytriomyces cf. hyalinus JEL632]|nr:hypothetical protein BJ741DRAFT_626245 [Chytriomyces cf. hyalinus JEL632]